MGKVSPATSMYIAIKKVNVQPILNEIHTHPFTWVFASIILFFVIGSTFEILWMLLRDIRRFMYKIFRTPVRFVKYKVVDPVTKKFSSRYGKKKRSDRTIFKK